MTSLGISPSHPGRSRPTPPGRPKRNSLTPTLRTNIAPGPPSPAASRREKAGGVMGGLIERSEDELRRAGREELVSALKGEWENRDKMTEHVDALESERRKLEKEREELVQSLGGLQSRVDDAYNEQSRLDADLEGRDELLEKMRTRISEGEKALRDGQKRYTEQEKSFEAEREAFRAQELHLETRIKTLSAGPSTSAKPASSTSAEDTEMLQEELASLSASHCTLIAQLNTVSSELGDLKEKNRSLEEENAGWELLMRERTLNGGMRGKGLLGTEWLDEGEGDMSEDEEQEEILTGRKAGRSRGRLSGLEALDEEMEGTMDGEMSTSPVNMQGTIRSAKGRKERKGESLGDLAVSGNGLDLAAELGRAEVDLDGGEMRALGKGEEGEALRAEVKQLRESNKALSLYCSKIIDRIIAQEGFEHVLAVDYKTRRLHNPSHRSRIGIAARTSVHDIVKNMQGDVPPPVPSLPAFVQEARAVAAEEGKPAAVKKARPMSMMARAFSSGPALPMEVAREEFLPVAPMSAVPAATREEEAKATKKAKRGFSIDFRSFGFGSAPAAPAPSPPEPKGLKPLQLPRRTASQSSRPPSVRIPSPPMHCPAEYGGITARKLDPQAEDEEDRRERHRMEAAMRLMGIDRSSISPSGGIMEELEPDMSAPSMTQSQTRTSTGSDSSASSRTTPLSRLSSRLASTLSPSLELADPMSPVNDDTAIAALAAFDKKEQEQSKMIAKGSYHAEFTAPSPSSSVRDRRASMRRGSGQSVDGQRTMGRGRMSKSGSVSTLWSAGSGSRPVSMEVSAAAEGAEERL